MTYRYEFDERVSIFHFLLDVHIEGSSHHGLEKEVATGAICGGRCILARA
jgi:hypothetical protein